MINWGLLGNPYNWVVVYLIAVLGVVTITFAHDYFNRDSVNA